MESSRLCMTVKKWNLTNRFMAVSRNGGRYFYAHLGGGGESMKSRAEQLDEMNKAILIATDRIRYYKQQDKMLQSEIRRLTRNERTHRLCTRGGMVESIIREPEKLTDDQVMELLTVAFCQPEVSELLQKMLEDAKANPLSEG